MSGGWADAAITRLQDANTCPVCESAPLMSGRCPRCGADLAGAQGATLWHASRVAVDALRVREAARLRIPRAVPAASAPAAGAPVPSGPSLSGPSVRNHIAHDKRAQAEFLTQNVVSHGQGVRPAGHGAGAPANDGASLQSVLATAGAALFAVAAIVFTFFNPELADRAVRSTIIGVVTLAFLAGAWLLARRRLQSSAEAVGGLGLVFVGLDVQAVAGSFVDDAASWTSAALATAVAGGLLLAAALRARIRIWLWAALPALASVPALLCFAVQTALPAALLLAAAGFAATGLIALLPRLAPRFPARETAQTEPDAAPRPVRRALAPEVAALTAVQLVVAVLAVARILFAGAEPIAIAVVLGVLAVHAVLAAAQAMPGVWGAVAGVLGVAAGAFAASSLVPPATGYEWILAIVPAGAVVMLIVGALVPLPRRTPRLPLAVGAGLAAGVTSAPAVLYAAMIGTTVLSSAGAPAGAVAASGSVLGPAGWPQIIALAVISAGFGAFALCARHRADVRVLRGAAQVVCALYAIGALFSLAAAHVLILPAAIGVLLAVTAVAAGVIVVRKNLVPASVRGILVVGAHAALLLAVPLSWQDRQLVPVAGVAAIAVLAVVARTIPRPSRFLHVGAGYGYALALVATALSLAGNALTGVGGIALLCLTASAGLLGAIVATFVPAVAARNWQAILVVATVPFTIAVVQVVFERSGWTALSTGLMFVLALSLLLTRRAGLTVVVRTLAAAMLVPSLAVVVLCLGAQLLVQSGSPVVLPVIALLVALVLPSGALIRDGLVARGRMKTTADAARVAIEASALLTAAIAVGLALVREAAGFGTACLVLIILGVGAALTSLLAGRRYGWWVAGAAFTGALWSLWALNGVELPEAYLLPPALGAVLVAVLLTLRSARATALFAAGLAGAIVPVLVLLVAGAGTDAVPWRAHGLLAAGWALLGVAVVLGRGARTPLRRLRPLRTPAALLASAAALGGTTQSVRWGSGLDASPVLGGDAGVFLLCVGMSALAALVLLATARMLRSDARTIGASAASAGSATSGSATSGAAASGAAASAASLPGRLATSRWVTVPAALAFAAGTWPAIAEDWFAIWGMWTLMLCWLVVMVRATRRTIADSPSPLPPVWVLFGISFITAVVAWSPRELRVEMFSLPLGAFLLAAGALAMRQTHDTAPARLDDWPHRWRGSWALLAPGLIVMLSASVVSTFTDPLTWRAILVMGIALAAILVGAARRLAAPFVIGLVVLPIENVFVFSVQLGRGIESMPWWITLATMGAVLLIIAVAGERREGAGMGVVARVRDLR